ncbi:hypothetical protein LUZ62_033922 [Rhynchospora pubera]|uniref:DUF642 domain-containing protein n=1 Tax=Rhynchospora pubera TaxID=906938 RepID=A0AAV8HZC8_9POAL|nr:hypothetical protein LUZ62_033922 [Rhynchospora pubera]
MTVMRDPQLSFLLDFSWFWVHVVLGLLPNGDFKDGPKSTEVNGTQVIGKFALPKWEIDGFVEYIESGHKQGDIHLLVPEGAYAVRLGNEASIKQRLKTVYSSIGWDSYSWGFQAKFSKVDLVIHNPGIEEDPACGPLIDAVAIQTLDPPPLTKYNVINNGDFEEGPYLFVNTVWGVLIPPMLEDVHSPLPAWMVESLKAVKYIDSGHYTVPQGKRAVELVAGRESALAQVVRTIPGKTYALTFSVGDAADGCVGYMMVEVYADPGNLKVPYESNGTGGFKKAILKFVETANRTRVVFLSSNYHMKFDGSLCGPVIDDVLLLSVHNPGRRLLRAT